MLALCSDYREAQLRADKFAGLLVMSILSLITLHKGRRIHLHRLVEGVGRGGAPDELTIVEMGGDMTPLPHTAFRSRRIHLRSHGLPLAAARNAGRRSSVGELLVFLDVDCIPAADFVASMRTQLEQVDGLVCCEVLYLPHGAVEDGWQEDKLRRDGIGHSARAFPTGRAAVAQSNAGLFWSLAFGVRAATYDALGGFDEAFTGYGAEDTDLAFRAAKAGVQTFFSPTGQVFHQHHAIYDPPLQHFADILRNARCFYARHGIWPMGGWLEAFRRLGLIRWTEHELAVVHTPTPAEIEAVRAPLDRAF